MNNIRSNTIVRDRIKELETEHKMTTRQFIKAIEEELIDESEGDYPEWVFLNGILEESYESR